KSNFYSTEDLSHSLECPTLAWQVCRFAAQALLLFKAVTYRYDVAGLILIESVSRSTVRSHSTSQSRSRSGSIRRSYTHSNRSRSATRSLSRRSSHSRRSSRSKSRSNYSRSHSGGRHSRSWSRSRSCSRSRSIYSSRSGTRSRSRSRIVVVVENHFLEAEQEVVHIIQESIRDHIVPIQEMFHLALNVAKIQGIVPSVLIGRILPCKHVLCYTCAMNLMKKCNRCQKSIQTVERCLVGGIFMCFESDGCRRTYLSYRDLQAHIDHRHRTASTTVTQAASINSSTNATTANNNINSVVVTKCDSIIHSEKITCLTNQINFTDETSRLPCGIKSSTNVNPAPISLSVDKTTSAAQMSLLGPSPRLVINTMVPPTCGANPPTIFLNSNQKNSGLLPLPPIQTSSSSTVFPNRLSLGIPRPIRPNNLDNSGSTTNSNNNNSNTMANNFPPLQQFTNCPPPALPPPPSIGLPNIRAPPPTQPPPAFLPNQLSVPSLSSTQHSHQNFSGASAVAALAAVVSAAMSAAAAQSKSSGITGVNTNLSGAIQQSLTNNQMQKHMN
ncbi:E3 ubiquitin-protein ligase, partial [Schistosoma japonicum]